MMDGVVDRVRLAARVTLAVAMGLAVVASSAAPASGRSEPAARCRPPSGYTTVVAVPGRNLPGFPWWKGLTTDHTPPGGVGGRNIDANDRGEVLHEWDDPVAGQRRTGVWRNGHTTVIDTSSGLAEAREINERGDVLFTNGVWQRGRARLIVAPEGSDFNVIAGHLGDGGHVAGSRVNRPGPGGGHPSPDKGFVWRNGAITYVVLPEPEAITFPVDIDRFGRTVFEAYGSSVLWDDGEIVRLGTLGGLYAGSNAMNDRGQVVGGSNLASGEAHAFLWEDGRMTDLHPVAGVTSNAIEVNEKGDAVGVVRTAVTPPRSVVWTCGRTVDLGIDSYENFPYRINDAGQVLSQDNGQVLVSTPIRR